MGRTPSVTKPHGQAGQAVVAQLQLQVLAMLEPLLIAPGRRVRLLDTQLTVSRLALLMAAYQHHLAPPQYFKPSQIWQHLMTAEPLEVETGNLSASVSVPSLQQVYIDAGVLRQKGLLALIDADTKGPTYSITQFGAEVMTSALVRIARPLVDLLSQISSSDLDLPTQPKS